jgi:adenylate cyclase
MKTIAALVLASVLLALVLQPAFFVAWDQKAEDLIAAWAPAPAPSGRVAVVEIDDRSLALFGRWPWPRDRQRLLFEKIQHAGADTVALDLMYPEPDLSPPAGSDDRLAATLRKGRFVSGFLFHFGPGQSTSPSCAALAPIPFVLVESESTTAPAYFSASGATCSVDSLTRASSGSGFLNASPDRDGILRRLPLIAAFNQRVYPSLALSAYMNYRRIPEAQLTANSSGAASLRLGNTLIPVDSKSDLLLRFPAAPSAFPHIAAADILNGSLPPAALQGKIVVVGVSASGLRESVVTPSGPSFAGYDLQAAALDNLLHNNALRLPRWTPAANLLLLLLLTLVSGWLLSRIEPHLAIPTLLALIALLWIASTLLVARTHILFSPLSATLLLGANLVILNLWKVSTEKWRTQNQRNIARKFIVEALTSLTAIHDSATGAHVLRVQRYAKVLAEALAQQPAYAGFLTPTTIHLIHELVPIHDIGKLSIPDSILRKPEPLTPEEFEIIKTHVTSLKRIFAQAVETARIQDQSTLQLASDIILTHHEHWDGNGYPEGLKGEQIPLVGRIVAVVDVYDALVSRRAYKEPNTHLSAMEYILNQRGTKFDPSVVDAFFRVEKTIQQIMSSSQEPPDRPVRLVPPAQGHRKSA